MPYAPLDKDGTLEWNETSHLENETLKKADNLSDVTDANATRGNINVYSKEETDAQILAVAGELKEVADITERDAQPTTVKRVYVLDNGDGNWAVYLRTSLGWKMLSDQDQYMASLTSVNVPKELNKTIANDKVMLDFKPVGDIIIMPLLVQGNKITPIILTKDTADTTGKTWKVSPKTAGQWDGDNIKGWYSYSVDTGVNPQ